MILGEPTDMKTLANIGTTEVDEQVGWIFRYSNGALAMLLLSGMRNLKGLVSGTIGNELQEAKHKK